MDQQAQNPPSGSPETPPSPAGEEYTPNLTSGTEPSYSASGFPPPPPPPPPTQQRRGFNWLACCGITCAVLVIIGGLVGYGCWQFMQPMVEMGMKLVEMEEEVNAADSQTIRASAVPIDATELAANPNLYDGQWVAVEGTISTSGYQGAFQAQDFDSEETTSYLLGDNIIVMDITHAPAIGAAGDRMRAYGKCYRWQLKKIPLVGKFMEEAMKSGAPGAPTSTDMVFVLTKDVELIGAAPASELPPDVSEEPSPASKDQGWIR